MHVHTGWGTPRWLCRLSISLDFGSGADLRVVRSSPSVPCRAWSLLELLPAPPLPSPAGTRSLCVYRHTNTWVGVHVHRHTRHNCVHQARGYRGKVPA